MIASNDSHSNSSTTTLVPSLQILLRFGALMLRSGATAFRVRQSLQSMADKIGLENIALQIQLNAITGSASSGGKTITLVQEVGPTGVNARRLAALETLTHEPQGIVSSQELTVQLTAIEDKPLRYSILLTSLAVGAACGAFAVLNGGLGVEVLAATVGGGIGQCVRSWLSRRRINQFAITALCALLASGVYCLLATVFLHMGIGVPRHTVGFISSVLFLIPGFPLIAALLDLLQHETSASITRLAYTSMLLLAAALGLSGMIELVGFSHDARSGPELSWQMRLALRTLASFVAGSGFAILFNCSMRNVVQVGIFSIVGNLIRLMLLDAGLGLPLATFAGSLAVGMVVSLTRPWIRKPRIALTVPAVIMMVPGLLAFDALVLFNQGEIISALRSSVLFALGVGAMAMGLAAARFIAEPAWLKE